MRWLLALALLVSPAVRAQAVVSAVLDAQGLGDGVARKAQRTTEALLRQLSGLSVGEGPAFRRGAPRRCEADCAAEVVRGVSAPGVALLDLKEGKGDRVAFELSLWLDGERLGARRGEAGVDGLEAALRPALEALLPAWARKGWGGVRLDVEPGSVVKLDGRATDTPPGQVVPVPAGVHQVDVVFPDGHAVLQRLEVAEGARARLDTVSPAPAVAGRARSGVSPLRAVSYTAWMAGAATVAAGLVAGALSKGTSQGMAPCTGDSRSCATLADALERNRQAAALASTGNVLLGVGLGLSVVGAGLFTIDAVAGP